MAKKAAPKAAKMPPKGMKGGQHKMPGGMMMSDSEMKGMMKKRMPMMAKGGRKK